MESSIACSCSTSPEHLAALIGFFGALLGALVSGFGILVTVRIQKKSACINHLSLALSDLAATFSSYQKDADESTFFSLVAAVERVRLFCSTELLPTLDSFREKVLNRSTPKEELGAAFRALVDLARLEVQFKKPRSGYQWK